MNIPPNKTTTETYWMIATFKGDQWSHDHGRFVDRQDCEDWIRDNPNKMSDYRTKHFPYRCTETIVKEYDAQ